MKLESLGHGNRVGRPSNRYSQSLSLQRSTFFPNIRCLMNDQTTKKGMPACHSSSMNPWSLNLFRISTHPTKSSKHNKTTTRWLDWCVFFKGQVDYLGPWVPCHSWKPSYVSSRKDPGDPGKGSWLTEVEGGREGKVVVEISHPFFFGVWDIYIPQGGVVGCGGFLNHQKSIFSKW